MSLKRGRAKEIIYDLLDLSPRLRDNDYELMLAVWQRQLDEHPDFPNDHIVDNMSVALVMSLIQDKALASPETVRRTRAKLQQLHPEYRGNVYEARHTHRLTIEEELREFGVEVQGPSTY